jgi:hypothetical protein
MATELERRNAAVYFNWLIDWYRGQQIMPAVGCGLVIGSEVVLATARGVRKHGTHSPVQPNDRFQMGSVTKPMTGMLIARLVDKGVLSWNQTIGQTWPDLFDGLNIKDGQKAHYGRRTIVDLMTHSSGMDYAPATESDAQYTAIHATPSALQIPKRKLYARLAVTDEPFHGWYAANGTPLFKYGGGCIVAAGMAQQALNKTWEMLIVTEPFWMGSSRWASPPWRSGRCPCPTASPTSGSTRSRTARSSPMPSIPTMPARRNGPTGRRAQWDCRCAIAASGSPHCSRNRPAT